MANRNTLHKSKLKDFESWLIENGWSIEPTKGIYEVLRARKTDNKPLIIFEKNNSTEHYTVPDDCWRLVSSYIKERKIKL